MSFSATCGRIFFSFIYYFVSNNFYNAIFMWWVLFGIPNYFFADLHYFFFIAHQKKTKQKKNQVSSSFDFVFKLLVLLLLLSTWNMLFGEILCVKSLFLLFFPLLFLIFKHVSDNEKMLHNVENLFSHFFFISLIIHSFRFHASLNFINTSHFCYRRRNSAFIVYVCMPFCLQLDLQW